MSEPGDLLTCHAAQYIHDPADSNSKLARLVDLCHAADEGAGIGRTVLRRSGGWTCRYFARIPGGRLAPGIGRPVVVSTTVVTGAAVSGGELLAEVRKQLPPPARPG